MKDAITRLSVYLLIILFFTSAFNGWHDCGNYPPADCAVQGVAYYGMTFGFWMAIFEGVFRLARYIRRSPRIKRIFFAVVGSYMIVQAAVWLFISIRQPEKLGVFILLLSGFFVWGGYVLIKKAKNLQQPIPVLPVPDTQPLSSVQQGDGFIYTTADGSQQFSTVWELIEYQRRKEQAAQESAK